MRARRLLHAAVAVCGCCLCQFSAAGANEPRSAIEHIEQGNADYEAGRYSEALQQFRQAERADAAALERIRPELWNNLAAAHFKLGQLDDARECWTRAAGLRDAKFEAAARFNLGNCDYAEALRRSMESQGEGVFETLDRAIEQYRDALRLNPDFADARANLQLAYQLRKQLEENLEPQSQPSPSDDSEESDQPPQDGQSSQPSSSEADSDPNQDQQDSQPDENPASQPESQPADDPADAPDEPEPPASQPQSQPSQPDSPQSQPSGAEAEQQNALLEMTPEEAARLLQQIRDLEQRRRAALRALEAQRQRPVERDW